MTQGSITGRAVLFALPICAGNILQLLYSTVDTLVIGNFCDAASLAAVGTSSQPLEILLCVFLGIGSGISVLVSQAVGKGDAARIRALARTEVWLLFIVAIPLTAVGVVLGPLILRAMQVPPDALPEATLYLRITTLGILGNMGYNFNAGLLNGLGNSASTLGMLGFCCVINTVLDLLFVAGVRMGVGGAALATSISLFCSWFFSIAYIRRRYPEVALPILPRGYDRAALGSVLRLGLPMGLNNALYSFGHIFLQALYNMQGTMFVAGCSVAGKVNGIANIAITSFSQASSVFAGQNLGAGRYRRLCRGAHVIPFLSGAVSLAGGLTVAIFCRPILMLFTRDEAVLDFAARFTRVVLPFQWCYAVFNGIMSFMNGTGRVRYTTIVNLVLLWVVRIPAAYIMAWFGYGEWAMASISLSFVTGMILMLFYFVTPHWRDLRAKAAAEGDAAASQGRSGAA